MPTAGLLPMPRACFFDQRGNPLSGGQVATLTPGGGPPKTTWQDAAETIPNSQPIILDADGSCLLYGSGTYTIVTTDALGNQVAAYSGTTTDILSAARDALSASFITVPNIAALRAATTTTVPNGQVYVLGYYTSSDRGEGPFVWISTDTTSADNGGTIIVDASGRRWYRELGSSPISFCAFGAHGDNVADDTVACQAALAVGGDIIADAGKTFLVNGLIISVPCCLTVQEGATIILNVAANAALLRITANNVVIQGPGTLDCNGATGSTAPEPIFGQSVTRLTIRDLTIQKSTNYGIHTIDCSQLVINNNTILSCNFYSIALYNITGPATDIEITGNRIDRTDVTFDPGGAGHCISVLNTTSGVFTTTHGIISNNLCLGKPNPVNQGIGITLFADTNTAQPFFDWSISGNSIEGGYFGISVGQGIGISVTGNSILNHKAYGIELVAAQDSAVTGNSIFGGSASTTGITVDAGAGAPSRGCVVSGNSVQNCSTAGIFSFQFVNNLTITGNAIDQTVGTGILAQSGTGHTITGNTINGNNTASVGIDGNGSLFLRIVGNNIINWNAGVKMANIDATCSFQGNGWPRGSSAWTPGVIGAGATAGIVIATQGSSAGDQASAGFSLPLAAGLSITANPNANNSSATIINNTAAPVTIGAGTVTVDVWRP